MARKIVVGIQDFERLRQEDLAYVDKTDLIYRMTHENLFCFFSRPRRFGKSLLLSTLKCYFEGKRDLFKGLAIDGLETEWVQYPVFHMDLSGAKYDRTETLEERLHRLLCGWEARYGASDAELNLEERFIGGLERAHQQTGQRVVLLVDEYDKPVLDAIGKPDLQEAYRLQLHSFYGGIKTANEHLEFVLISGIAKVGKLNVFSSLNNLRDLSMLPPYAALCGITEQELRQNFDAEVQAMAESNGLPHEEMYAQLKKQYDGYHFAKNSEGVYNPFSLLTALADQELGSYWFESGTPTFLTELAQRKDCQIDRIGERTCSENQLRSASILGSDLLPMLYKGGYLTLKSYDPAARTYRLGYPNKEVEEATLEFFVPYYMKQEMDAEFSLEDLLTDINEGDAQGFLNGIIGLMADTSYEIIRDLEVHVQNFCYLLFKLLGYRVSAEYHTSNGRIDLVFYTKKFIYLIEFKRDQSAEEAISQIKANAYAEPFLHDPRKKFLIGISYSLKTRGPGEYRIEEG